MVANKTESKSWLDMLFRSKDGELTVLQWPNSPLLIWVVATVISHLASGALRQLSSFTAFVVIAIWAIRELSSGASIFRRVLGAIVLSMALINRF